MYSTKYYEVPISRDFVLCFAYFLNFFALLFSIFSIQYMLCFAYFLNFFALILAQYKKK